jgi:transmembrane sensor
MNSDPRPPDAAATPELIEAAAAAWLSLRDRGMSAAETAEFVRWLQQDPQHATVFAELDAVWKNFDRLGAVPAPAARVAPAPDGDLLAPRVRSRHHRTLTWGVLGAAAAAAIVLLAVAQFRAPRHSAETAVGAFQKLDLPDGSVAQLNTDTAIDTTFTATERRVRVVRGEVFFTVTKDPARPFIVTAGPVAVRAVGTAFNVRHDPTGIEVLVTEGRVRVDDAEKGQSLLAPADGGTAPPLLVAGERALVPVRASDSVPALASVAKVAAPGVQRALAWQERRLEFDAEPLGEVVREFNRYNRTRLVIADEQLAAKRFSGTFRADGYESLVRLLEADFGVTATRREGEIELRVRR